MEYDIFFSISQTPDHNGFTPSESQMFSNYYAQLEAADRLGFGVAWIAQAHLSTFFVRGIFATIELSRGEMSSKHSAVTMNCPPIKFST